MRISYKLGFLAAVTLAGANAFAAIDIPDTGNGELVLFVADAANPQRVYARGLNIHMNDILTQAQAAAAGAYQGAPTEFSRNIADIAADDVLTTFLAGGSSYTWTIMGGSSKIVGFDPIVGERRYATTIDPNISVAPFEVSNGLIAGAFSGLNNTIGNFNNEPFSATDSIATGGTWGTDGSDVWYAAGLYNGNVFPTSGTSSSALYVLANSSTSSSGTAQQWLLSTAVTLDAQGNLSFGATTEVPQVPVPAAVWLLGSALAGLATVRRRRNESDAIAA